MHKKGDKGREECVMNNTRIERDENNGYNS